MFKVTFLGAGSFGTALAVLLAEKNNDIRMWDRNIDVINDINVNRTNSKYLKNLEIPKNVTGFANIKEALKDSNYVILAIPSHAIREICKKIKKIIPKESIVISIAKGIEAGTDKRLSEVIKEEIDNPVVIMSGPSHAEEVALKLPTTLVVSSENMKYANSVQDLFMFPTFRVYTNDDLIGVEIGGAVKNIIALASGIADGIGYGDNTKAALMTRGMKEISRIGEKLGGRPDTFFGLTGMGDLIVTCTSMHSRNRRAGILIGKGFSVKDALSEIGMVVEGVKACKAFYELKKKEKVSMPITDALYKVLFEDKKAVEGVKELMIRDKKHELF